jgi:hypothetical protein
MTRTGFFAIAGVLASLACRGDAAPTESREAFDAARARWETSRPSSYTFVAHRSCECTAEAAGPARIAVSGGAVLDVRRVSDGGLIDASLWFTVDGLFNLIESEFATRPELIDAEYHAVKGYPTSVTYGMPEVDAGATITISEFKSTSPSLRRT